MAAINLNTQALIQKLITTELVINRGENDGNKKLSTEVNLEKLFKEKTFLDQFKKQGEFRIKPVTQVIDFQQIEVTKSHFVIKLVEYINCLSGINFEEVTPQNFSGNELTVNDKIILLRYAYAPLLIFEFALGTLISSNEEYKAQYVGFSSFLCLPLEERFEIPKNSFLTKEVVEKVTIKLVRFLGNLELNKEEFVLFKLFFTFGLYSVVLNDVEREKLSDNGEIFVEKFYDCAINLMHNYSSTKALKFFTKFQPELLSISRELVEDIKMEYANSSPTSTDNFFGLFHGLFDQKIDEQFDEQIDEDLLD